MKTWILHESSKEFYWKGEGALSIKTFRNGQAFYQTGHGHYAVEEGAYLLLNKGQEYSITIESETPVESFCLFFPEKLVEEVYHSLVTSSDQLLLDPCVPAFLNVDFIEKTYNNDPILNPILINMRAEHAQNQNDDDWLDEQVHQVMQSLLQVHRNVYHEISKLPSLRASTREELYRRIHIGHDYISAYYNHPLTLAEMAKAASLSPTHFLRNYKKIVGVSPHQFLKEKRLQEAKKLLLRSDRSVTEVCLEVGFQSLSSFSGLFARRFGLSPNQLRKKR